jgi:hypothetical protein
MIGLNGRVHFKHRGRKTFPWVEASGMLITEAI